MGIDESCSAGFSGGVNPIIPGRWEASSSIRLSTRSIIRSYIPTIVYNCCHDCGMDTNGYEWMLNPVGT